eukprot:PhF_6_TR43144/c0_g1_i1/m.66028
MGRVTLLSCDTEHYLICTIPNRQEGIIPYKPPQRYEAVVLTLNSELKWTHTNTPRVDVFDSTDRAVGAIQSKFPTKEFVMQSYRCLLGALRLDHMYLLISDVAEATMLLPGNCNVYEIRTWKWISLRGPSPTPHLHKAEREILTNTFDTTFHTGYFFCDEVNLMSPFPYNDVSGRDWFQCDWLHYLRKPFEEIGLPQVCTRVIRGFAQSKTINIQLPNGDHTQCELALVGRQSYHNPGPRFFSRGLNDVGAAGNDLTYDLIMYYVDPTDGALQYSRHTFFRGTAPVHFLSTLHGAVGEATITLKPEPLKSTSLYFTRLLRKITAIMQLDRSPDDVEGAAALLPEYGATCQSPRARSDLQYPALRCFNLLRCVSSAGEDILSKAYESGVAQLKSSAANKFVSKCDIDYVQMDYLATVKDEGIESAVEKLWNTALEWYNRGGETNGITRGTFNLSNGTHTVLQSQRNFIRFNCADSLDRTNLGGFFAGIQVTFPLLSSLGINIVSAVEKKQFTEGNVLNQMTQGFNKILDSIPMPLSPKPGNTKTTIISTMKNFVPAYAQIRDQVPPAVLTALVNLFVANGDTIAMLYTTSPALSTDAMRKFVPGMPSAPPNAVISSQRRYQNVFEDKKRMKGVDVLMGINHVLYFPSLFQSFVLPLPIPNWGRAIVLFPLPSGVVEEDVIEAIGLALHCTDCVEMCRIGVGVKPPVEQAATSEGPTELLSPKDAPQQVTEDTPPLMSLSENDYEVEVAVDNNDYVAVVLMNQDVMAKKMLSSRTIKISSDVETQIVAYGYRIEPAKSTSIMNTLSFGLLK